VESGKKETLKLIAIWQNSNHLLKWHEFERNWKSHCWIRLLITELEKIWSWIQRKAWFAWEKHLNHRCPHRRRVNWIQITELTDQLTAKDNQSVFYFEQLGQQRKNFATESKKSESGSRRGLPQSKHWMQVPTLKDGFQFSMWRIAKGHPMRRERFSI
jgi:hypothetical protein